MRCMLTDYVLEARAVWNIDVICGCMTEAGRSHLEPGQMMELQSSSDLEAVPTEMNDESDVYRR